MSKDLAEEYTKRTYKEKTNYPIMWRDKVFTGKDIEAAFNAGRDSVVENILELEWRNLSYEEEYYSSYSLGFSYRVMQRVNEFALFCN